MNFELIGWRIKRFLLKPLVIIDNNCKIFSSEFLGIFKITLLSLPLWSLLKTILAKSNPSWNLNTPYIIYLFFLLCACLWIRRERVNFFHAPRTNFHCPSWGKDCSVDSWMIKLNCSCSWIVKDFNTEYQTRKLKH